jgi:hypothetical protein
MIGETIEDLARVLFDEIDRSDPSGERWDDLPEVEKSVYRRSIKNLVLLRREALIALPCQP